LIILIKNSRSLPKRLKKNPNGLGAAMSKLSPTGQSMAALFTPERERLRAAQKDTQGPQQTGNAFRVPGVEAIKESSKMQDCLGNPMSPGYEPPHQKEAGPAEAALTPAGKKATGFLMRDLGPNFVRLGVGWEKLLTTQRKLCEKAKGLLTILEGPARYRSQRKSSALEAKCRGSILDLDTQDMLENQPETEKKKKAA
jgi:hypothetical protein